MEEKKVIGLMSGTSIDEIDACMALIRPDLTFQIIDTTSLGFPEEVKNKILDLANNKGSIKDVCEMNFILGKLFAKCTEQFGIKADIISSHGQTIWHIPQSSTLQIGDISIIANETNTITVGDFRPADIAVGGHGAPLVPFADEVIFGRDEARCIQNIGGISNVTVLNPKGPTMAFDTGPGNMLIDHFAQTLFMQKCDYDGRLANQGRIDNDWLEWLLKDPYYAKKPPKTTGRELFSVDYARKIIHTAPKNPHDIMATITALTAKTIYNAYEEFIFPKVKPKEIILGGGGVYNKYLLNLLDRYFYPIGIKTHDDFGVPNKYKEALAFAILGYCTYYKMPNNLPSCTGAKRPVVMGKVAYPSC
jgi:anhydro-N-acetylmuramic acid kinase